MKLPLTPYVRIAGEQERRHPTAAIVAPAQAFDKLDGIRVLVVDDEPDSNEAVSIILSAAGAEVRVAASASHAIAEIEQWLPTVIVSDIGIPVEDGYSLIRRVRALDGAAAKIPAVALTAYASSGDRIRVFSSGFQGHVAKPVEPAELVAVVGSVSGISAPAPPPASTF